MKRILLLFFGVLLLSTTHAFAGGYYYYQPEYRPYAYRGPTGAALGPFPWTFEFGGGPTSLPGESSQILDPGWNFQVGAGVNFTPRVGLLFEYLDNGLGVDNQYLKENKAIDGYSHVWALTADPIWRYKIAGPLGGYIIGGGGFYERQIDLTQAATVFVPTYHGGYYASGYEVNRQTDDVGGVNIGAGFTCHLGYGTKLFVEARYHYIFTEGTPTKIIPVTVGLRW